MRNNILKAKSFSGDISDIEMESIHGVVRTLSYHAIIDLFHNKYNIKDKIKGFKIGDLCLEIIYE